MAAPKRNASWIEETRRKIRGSQLINRLSDHVFGKVELSPTQVSAARILLAKCLPDLVATENKTEVTHRYVARAPAPAPSTDEWQKQHVPPTMQ